MSDDYQNTEYMNLCRARNNARNGGNEAYKKGYAKIKWLTDEERAERKKKKEKESECDTGEGQCTSSERNTTS